MSNNYGKAFEQKFKEDFKKTFPKGSIDRIYDSVLGYKSISNVADFICYVYPNIYYIELKSHKGASIPFENITQYEKLKYKVGIPGVRAGVILWLYEKDKVLYIPVSTITKMKEDGKKSVGIKAFSDGYILYEIPSIKKRVFMDTDYSILTSLKDKE